MEEKFQVILDKDEKIVKIFKPNKCKTFFSALFLGGLTLLFFCALEALGMFVPDEVTGETMSIWWIFLPIGMFVVGELLILLFTVLSYKNKFFAYTNKRVLIRKGIFGVDYKALDMSMIGAIDVNVTLIDKILRKNTGTIRFGSTSSPMTSGQYGTSYIFENILDPYNTYKEIKAYIDEYKETSTKNN